MLEKTVVFVSEDIQYSSCAVLAMRALVEPFKIWFAMVPVMPQLVIEYLSAPVPLLVGMTSQLMRQNKLDYFDATWDLNEEINWVNLSDENYTLWQGDEIIIPFCSNLKEVIREDYEFIRSYKKNLVEHQNDDIEVRVTNIVNRVRDSIFENFIAPTHLSDFDFGSGRNETKFNKEMPSPRSRKLQKTTLRDLKFDHKSDQVFFNEFFDTLMFQSFLEQNTESKE